MTRLMSEKNVHGGHRSRVKARLLSEGMDAFEDHQVLELMLFYCIPMKDTNEIAHKMLKEFGSLTHLFEAQPEEIAKKCNVSINTAIFISMVPSLSRRYLKGKWGEKPLLNSSTKAGEYVLSLLSGRTYEMFYVICLDSQNKVTFSSLVHEGTINEAAVYPRLIVETALRYKAVNVILAHNHPGGGMQPSKADIEVTVKIKEALKVLSIGVVDHIISAGDRYFSFAESNLL